MATRNRKPTKAERRAHDVRMAELFSDTAGQRADLRPCACCGSRDHGGELGPAQDEHGHDVSNWCTPCANRAWDRAAHRAAFWDGEPHSDADVRSDAAW
jgi:hypothetical protein